MNSQEARFLMYRAAEDEIAVNALVKDDTIWLNQKGMAELFDVQPPAISKHLKNIFAEGELQEEVVVSKMEITAAYGKGFTARSILKLLATDSKIQSSPKTDKQICFRYICFFISGLKIPRMSLCCFRDYLLPV